MKIKFLQIKKQLLKNNCRGKPSLDIRHCFHLQYIYTNAFINYAPMNYVTTNDFISRYPLLLSFIIYRPLLSFIIYRPSLSFIKYRQLLSSIIHVYRQLLASSIHVYTQLLSSIIHRNRKKPLFVIGHMAPEQNFYIQYIMKSMVTWQWWTI